MLKTDLDENVFSLVFSSVFVDLSFVFSVVFSLVFSDDSMVDFNDSLLSFRVCDNSLAEAAIKF